MSNNKLPLLSIQNYVFEQKRVASQKRTIIKDLKKANKFVKKHIGNNT